MKTYYYVGQKVSHQAFGDGEVIRIDEGNGYPVVVKFDGSERIFTADGRHEMVQHPSLSQKPHVPLELEEIVTFEKGELVWVKRVDTWEARYYSHFEGKGHYFFVSQRKDGNTIYATEVRKFSDNPLTLNCYK